MRVGHPGISPGTPMPRLSEGVVVLGSPETAPDRVEPPLSDYLLIQHIDRLPRRRHPQIPPEKEGWETNYQPAAVRRADPLAGSAVERGRSRRQANGSMWCRLQ